MILIEIWCKSHSKLFLSFAFLLHRFSRESTPSYFSYGDSNNTNNFTVFCVCLPPSHSFLLCVCVSVEQKTTRPTWLLLLFLFFYIIPIEDTIELQKKMKKTNATHALWTTRPDVRRGKNDYFIDVAKVQVENNMILSGGKCEKIGSLYCRWFIE